MKMMSRAYRNKKGFSLVELIIVVAIMVALVAVIAPAYVKYVQEARDAVVDNSAEDIASFIKSEYAVQNFTAEDCEIKIGRDADYHMDITLEKGTLKYDGATDEAALAKLKTACNIDPNRLVRSDKYYILKISSTDETITLGTMIEIESTTGHGSET